MVGVAEFVYEHVINEVVWQLHESDVETNGAGTAAATPSTAGVAKANALVMKTVFGGELRKSIGQHLLGLAT